eukprot:scaffold209863_cov36-Prasinocladus_malaysianus.AAC.1
MAGFAGVSLIVCTLCVALTAICRIISPALPCATQLILSAPALLQIRATGKPGYRTAFHMAFSCAYIGKVH